MFVIFVNFKRQSWTFYPVTWGLNKLYLLLSLSPHRGKGMDLLIDFGQYQGASCKLKLLDVCPQSWITSIHVTIPSKVNISGEFFSRKFSKFTALGAYFAPTWNLESQDHKCVDLPKDSVVNFSMSVAS